MCARRKIRGVEEIPRAICTVMPQIQHGLTPAEYLSFRERHLPAHPKIIFVLESPPKSGLYFYKPGAVSEPLFSAMMKDVLEIKPKTKEEGLSEFAFRGFLLIDATYKPVNHPHLSQKERNEVILKDSPLLLEELQKFADPETKVVFVKANVFRLLEPKVTDAGFVVLNRGMKIPFPSDRSAKEIPRGGPAGAWFGSLTKRSVLGCPPTTASLRDLFCGDRTILAPLAKLLFAGSLSKLLIGFVVRVTTCAAISSSTVGYQILAAGTAIAS